MDFVTAVKSVLGKYVDFSGRASRSEYWFFFLFYIVASIIANVLDAALTGGLLSMVLGLGLFLPSLAVAVRRLHDLDKSGWWILIFLIPLIGFFIWIFWFAGRGTEGENRFGSDPLGGAAAIDVTPDTE